jgi:hypothetical protein
MDYIRNGVGKNLTFILLIELACHFEWLWRNKDSEISIAQMASTALHFWYFLSFATISLVDFSNKVFNMFTVVWGIGFLSIAEIALWVERHEDETKWMWIDLNYFGLICGVLYFWTKKS